jgi:lipopolysaccharide/colanic/teichoic acid biosynthesis glycosyltransferase
MIYKISSTVLNFLGATLGLIIIAPLMPIIALAITLESKGPILVKLPRVSMGKIIQVYKFRSMVHGAHEMKNELLHLNERADGPFFKIKHDPRVTKSGRLIRRFRIDEFPQLINVLKGELSLVGPRPHELEEIIHYPEEYHHLLFAKAGVTGLSQVNGASSLPFLRELQYDSEYVQKQSVFLDMKIITKTLAILFFDHNAV